MAIRTKTIRGPQDGGSVTVLTTPSSLLQKVGLGATPTDFGLPDLLVDGLTPEQQNAALKQMVESQLFVQKDGRRLPIVMIEPMVRSSATCSTSGCSRRSCGSPVGAAGPGGGHPHLADDGLPAEELSRYGGQRRAGKASLRIRQSQFWYCVPGLAEALLDGDPLQSETRLKNGVTLSCVPASEKAARGKHVAGFVADESCQEDSRVGKVLQPQRSKAPCPSPTSRSSC
jgi:hypothetical protein